MDTEVLSDHKTNNDYTFDIIHLEDGDITSLDFGLEIVADVDNFISTEAPPLLNCVSMTVFAVDINHISNKDSLFLFNIMP